MSIKVFAAFIAFGVVLTATGVPLDRNEINDQKKETPIVSQNSRIIGGTVAPEGYAPHMVALVFGDMFVMLVCGGSIVKPQVVLTAAHCIFGVMLPSGLLLPSFRGIIGSNRYNSQGDTVLFSEYVNHPEYDAFLYKNDIGVLIPMIPMVYTARIAPISLDFEYIWHEERCFVTGWGETGFGTPEQLQMLNVSTISHEVCEAGVQKVSHPWSGPPVDPIVEICTFHSRGHGMCMGDSGSALVSRRTGRQIGIVAWGFPCAIGAPDVFARISGFKAFMAPFLVDHGSESS